MSNKTLTYLTIIVLVAIATLFLFNISSLLELKILDQPYLKYNDVRGMAIDHNALLYTLNFQQQNEIIKIFNESVRVVGIKPGKRQPPDINKIVVYQFDNLPDLIIQPVAYIDGNLVFSSPSWNNGGLLMELSDGKLQNLLLQTHDN